MDAPAPGARAGQSLPATVTVPLHVGAPLSLGFALYALRPSLVALAGHGAPAAAPLVRFVAFNLADGLWMYALVALLSRVWPERGVARTAWLGGALALGAGHEVAQAAGVVRGTFDWLDLFVFAAAFALAIALAPRPTRRSH